jgi:2'-hydroxyisoflavone reductase
MRILILGGTRFVGRHITQAALDRGHDVSVFHRGRTGDDLFPQAEHLTGDRNVSLAALDSGRWDATIDVSAYLPRQVRELATALDGRGGHHVYISSVSVYQAPVAPGFSESAPLIELDDPEVQEVTNETYGGLKVACERSATALYGAAGLTVIRPTYVIGPWDYTYRFTYWVERLARGGRVLAPGNPVDPIQVIDARDQATFTVGLLERAAGGVFHTVSPAPPHGFGDMLEAIASRVAPAGTQITWVSSEFLTEAGQDESSLPLWPGDGPDHDISAASPAAAVAAGLAVRPLGDSVADIHAAEAAEPTTPPDGTGISAAREAELLAKWSAR